MTAGALRLAVLVSGRGSNLAAVLEAVADRRLPDIEPVLVISNRAGVPALGVAADAWRPEPGAGTSRFRER